jgi:chromosome segregation ATPase
MTKAELKQLIKEQWNTILAEAKMFDNPAELISGVDKFLSDLYTDGTTTWKSTLTKIIEQDTSYSNIATQLSTLIEQVEKNLNIINNFDEDISSHIREYDEIYQKSGELSSEDDKAYDELEELDSRLYAAVNQIEEYRDNLKELQQHYTDLDDLMTYFRRHRFKSL